MRLRTALLFVSAVACGNDDKPPPNPDTPPPPPPEDTGTPFKNYDANEGGEVRMEYVNFLNGNAAIRVTAYNYKTAGSMAFWPLLSANGCTDLDKSTGHWPTAQNPVAERVYEEPGLVVIAGGPNAFTARPNAADGKDALGRDHPAGKFSFSFGGAMANDAANFSTEKTAYTVTFTGSDEIPAQVFPDIMWMPANFQMIDPPFAPVTITAGTPLTATWTTPPQDNPADHEILSLVAFVGPLGPSAVCVEPNDGSMTIPAEMIDKVIAKYPGGGTFARQTLTHVVKELVDKDGPTGNRIDFISVWCFAGTFTVL